MIRFHCEKAILQTAVNAASRAAGKSGDQAQEGLLFTVEDKVTICGYTKQKVIRSTVDAEIIGTGSIVINAKLVSDILRTMPDDTLTFDGNPDSLTIHLSCGAAAFDIVGISSNDFPDQPVVEEQFSASLTQASLQSMIDQVIFAVSTSESRPIHTGALFEADGQQLTMVAVDGYRLAIRREPLLTNAGALFSFVAPGSALNDVKGLCSDCEDPVTITMGKRYVSFEVGSNELVCRLLEGDFLDYRHAIPRTNPIRLSLDKRSMIESIDRVSTVISEKLKSPLRCVFEKDKVYLSAKTAIGEAKDICDTAGDGNGLEIGFNNRYLLDAFRHVPSDTVCLELNTGIAPAIIVPPEEGNEKFLYMVLPVRLKSGG